ncbi:MAG TPA: NAD(P)H-binding protein [Actinoplanes sp.]|nr:NAD(P)H-binding protein [Actinoplanes sp.]
MPNAAGKVLVIGASGYLGRQVSRALLSDRRRVRCSARDPERLQDLAAVGCETVRADISDGASMDRALESIDAVYVCIHTLSPQAKGANHQDFMEIEKNGLANVVNACKAQGTQRLIYVTSLGIEPDAQSAWLRGRWQAEQFLLGSGLDVTIIQSGQIVGVGARGFDSLVGQARRPLAIDIGDGQQRALALHVDDLVYYLVGVLDDPRAHGRRFDVGADQALTNDQMIDVIAEVLNRRPPAKVHLPLGLVASFAPLVTRLAKLPPGAIQGALDSLRVDMTGDPDPIRTILPRVPLPYREAVAKALATGSR